MTLASSPTITPAACPPLQADLANILEHAAADRLVCAPKELTLSSAAKPEHTCLTAWMGRRHSADINQLNHYHFWCKRRAARFHSQACVAWRLSGHVESRSTVTVNVRLTVTFTVGKGTEVTPWMCLINLNAKGERLRRYKTLQSHCMRSANFFSHSCLQLMSTSIFEGVI